MKTHILTRFATIIVFVFTCSLTMDVVASDRGLAPQLSPNAWKLLSDVEAIVQGYEPAIVQTFTLEPRRKIEKKELIKRPNSRIKVKFADDLKIRLDVHNKPYSRTMQPQSVSTVCDSLGITLVPTISRSQDDVDALIYKAESISRKQMPDIGGIYWITGDETAADVAAEIFWTMEEVEWVMYKPVYSKMPKALTRPDFSLSQPTITTSTPKKKATSAVAPKAPADTTFGACLFDKNECFEDMGQWACGREGGTFLGQNSICFVEESDDLEETDRAVLPLTGECCLLTGCVKVGIEAGLAPLVSCEALNGVLISIVVAPAIACATNTVCPAGIGPTFASYSTCGVLGTPVTLLTGDCYIDQTVLVQTSRVSPFPNPPPNGPPFPIGCADNTGLTALGTLAGPAGADFVVSTGLFLTQASNVFAGSACCETISADVPNCATLGWNAICASYAQAYATDGSAVCLRSPANPVAPPSPCLGPLGPMIIPAFIQPTVNMSSPFLGGANSGILLTNPTGGGTPNSSFQIVEVPAFGTFANGCANNDCFLFLFTNGVQIPTIPGAGIALAGGTLNALATTITTVALNGFVATVEGPAAAGATVLDNQLNPTSVVFLSNTLLPGSPFSQSLSTIPIPIGATSGCLSSSGVPTFARAAATPDYAGLGLLAWMTPNFIPSFANATGTYAGQFLAMPCLPIVGATSTQYGQATLTNDEIFHISQLLPWPMGGAGMQGTAAQVVALAAPVSAVKRFGIGWWGGESGVDLFPDAPNPGGFGGAEVYKGAYGYGQFWADQPSTPNGTGINGAFGNGVKIAVLDWSAHLQEFFTVDEFGTTVNLGGIHEEFVQGAGGASPGSLRVLLEGTATGHDPLFLNFDENLPFGYSADHGTAVLGVLGANWSPASPLPGTTGYPPTLTTRLTGNPTGAAGTENVGVLGMAPDATLMFFPLSTAQVQDREEQAWFNAIESLNAGDVICAAYLPVSTNGLEPNLNYWADTSSYLQIANGLGICTVIRAGDLGIDLSAIELPNGDQNVFVATAVTPGSSNNNILFNNIPVGVPGPPTNPLTPNVAKRYCDGQIASNFSVATQGDYSDVTASGWGIGVITCGKGQLRDNYLGFNTITYAGATTYASPASDPHIVHAQAYTNNFGYTGAAAAQVAGAVAITQGFTRQIFGIPMGPQICRQLIAGGAYAGRNRDGTPILRPAPQITIETGRDSECETVVNNLDWDWCPVVGGNLVGNLNDPRNAMVNTILNPIFDTPNIDNALFIRGVLNFGNRLSLAAIDGNFLSGNPVRVDARTPYSVPAGVPGGPVYYAHSGMTTDLYLHGELDSLPSTNLLTINAVFEMIQQPLLFIRAELLNQRTGKWQAVAGSLLTQGATGVLLNVSPATPYISSTNQYDLRLITLSGVSPNEPNAAYPISYDQVRIGVNLIQH